MSYSRVKLIIIIIIIIIIIVTMNTGRASSA